MKKDLHKLSAETFDLVIIGGGIHGALLASTAARRGHRVALVEQGDFGHSTSANSLKIVHGGIRYLQHGDFKRMRESIRSRRMMMRFAPHLVKPLACLMPTYGHGMKGRELMRLAFGVYDLIACDRNRGLPAANRLPAGGRLSVPEVRWVVPGINEEGLTGGAVWYDAIAENTERLILEYIKDAVRFGAVVANYVQAKEVVKQDGQVQGVEVVEKHSQRAFQIACRNLVSAAGPWLDTLGATSPQPQLWATAVNIVVKKQLFRKFAVGLEGYTDYTDKDALIKRGKRLFFFVPWRNHYTMIGTSYTPYRGTVDGFALGREELQQLLADINKIYPPGGLTLEDVSYFHAGLLPMNEADEKQSDSVQLDKSSMIIDHGKIGGPAGWYSIKGVKYTTAPDIAEKVLHLLEKQNRITPSSRSGFVSIPPRFYDFGPVARALGEEYEEIRRYLEQRYSGDWRDVFSYFQNDRAFIGGKPVWLSQEPPLLAAEVLYFIHEEMASRLADTVLRRSGLGSAECPPQDILTGVARLMAAELGWSDEEVAEQLADVASHYGILHEA